MYRTPILRLSKYDVATNLCDRYIELWDRDSPDVPRIAHIMQTVVGHIGSSKEVVYHGLEHVLSMLEFAETVGVELTKNQQLAIMFHDAIYYSNKKDNEKQSANFAASLLGGVVSKKDIKEIKQIINDTAQYMGGKVGESSEIVCDLDLSGFIMDFPSRKANTMGILIECITSDITDAELKVLFEKRTRFLESMISKGWIYRTEKMKQYDDLAIRNIRQEIEMSEVYRTEIRRCLDSRGEIDPSFIMSEE